MSTKLLNFSRLRKVDHFDEHFQIAIELIVEDFEADRHFLVDELKQPTCDILFQGFSFDKVRFTFTMWNSNYASLAKDPLQDYVTQFLLKTQARLSEQDTIDSKSLVFRKIDTKLVGYFIGAPHFRFMEKANAISGQFINKTVSTQTEPAA